MGIFGKKVSQTDKNLAANAFADREKPSVSTEGDGVENRIFGYNKLKGAETLQQTKAQESSPTRIEELRRIRDAQQRDKVYDAGKKSNASEQADAAAKAVAGDAITARKNLISSNGIARRKELSAEERAEIERQGMGALGGVTDALQNKKLLTEIDDIERTGKAGENLSSSEIGVRTAAFRNIGFITETEAEYRRPLTEEEKLEQDIEELESAEKAIMSFTNAGFRNQNQGISNKLGEETVEEEGE